MKIFLTMIIVLLSGWSVLASEGIVLCSATGSNGNGLNLNSQIADAKLKGYTEISNLTTGGQGYTGTFLVCVIASKK